MSLHSNKSNNQTLLEKTYVHILDLHHVLNALFSFIGSSALLLFLIIFRADKFFIKKYYVLDVVLFNRAEFF